MQNAALRLLGKLAHRGEAPHPQGRVSRAGRTEDTQPPAHTPNQKAVPKCLAAGDSFAAAASCCPEPEEVLLASGRRGSAGGRRAPSRELRPFTWVAASGRRAPGEPGGWCGEDRGRRSRLLLRAGRAVFIRGPGPLREYWAIGPATRGPGSRRPLPPPSPAAAAAAACRERGSRPPPLGSTFSFSASSFPASSSPLFAPCPSPLRGTLASLNRL